MKVWALLGRRVGDNDQVLALCKKLGWPYETKQLVWKNPLPSWTPFYGRLVKLDDLTNESRSTLQEPWPDLVVSIGWRSVPVAQWIRRESGAKHVQIGRPRAPLHIFDLVISSPQYRLPASQNVIKLSGPLVAASGESRPEDLDRWESEFSDMPAPMIAVLIGGNAPPLHFTRASVTELAKSCNDLARKHSGSLLITNGPRTPPWVLDLFVNNIDVSSFQNAWGEAGPNPYVSILALADMFVVTNDSISMAQEAANTGKPLFLFHMPAKNGPNRMLQATLEYASRDDNRLLAPFINKLVRDGIIYLPRFPQDFHAGLIKDGQASILGSTASVRKSTRNKNNLATAAEAVKKLFRDKEETSKGM